jgi:hypothetical protein
VDNGQLDRIPSPWQLRAGWLANLPAYLSETDRERQVSRRTWLGQVPIRAPIQALYCNSHLSIDTGLGLSNRQVTRHLLCVYHEPAFLAYDLQLLQSQPGGLDMLQREVRRVLRGQTAWAPVLRRVVGGPGYHEQLADFAESARRFEYPERGDLDPRFASVHGFASFCASLPDWPAERGFYGFDLDKIDR